MRILYVLMFFLMMSVTIHAQFINNGATVTIQSGATLRIETDFINNSGTVTNNGVLEVKEDFTNAAAATFTSAVGSTVKFIGDTPSTVTSNGDAFHHVSMEKTAENITLADAMSVAGTLTFTNDNNKVILGANNLTIQDGGSIASADDNEYVVADGAGSLIKGLSANGTITHEIGDASNYTPLSSAVTGSAYASATLGARVVDAIHPNKPTEADSYLSRYWVVNANGITGYANTMTGTYASAGDIVGTASRVKGASYAPSTWTYTNAATNGTSTVTGSTTVNAVDFTGMNALNKVDITAYLYGAMPSSGTTMTNDLQTYGQYDYSETRGVNMGRLEGLVSIYPNPATDIINVDLTDMDLHEGIIHLSVYDNTGKAIISKEVNGAGIEPIQASNMAAGSYQVVVKQGDTTHRKQIIVVN